MRRAVYKPYSAENYRTLPHYDAAKDVEVDEETQKEIAWIFQRWGVGDIAGLTLLHQHFAIEDNEILIRDYDRDKNEVAGGVHRLPAAGSLIEYIWRMRMVEGQPVFTPVEFLRSTADISEYRYQARILRLSADFQNELYGLLVRKGLERFFGVSLLPGRLFRVAPGETLLENSNDAERTFTISKVAVGSFDNQQTTQTLWAFPKADPNNLEGIICIAHCAIHCALHCAVHCGVHCAVHCGVHCAVHCGTHCDTHCDVHCRVHCWRHGIDP